MDNILLSGGLAFLITFFSIPVIIEVAKDKKLFDEPDERKVHKAVIPTLGGLGIFAGFIVASLLGVPSSVPPVFQYFVAAIMVIFFLGIKDDILILSASKKFIGQLVAAGIIIKFGGIQINDMHGFLGLHAIPHSASILLTLFTIVVITNSFNLIDGVDGLAGSLGLLTSSIFGVYFLATHQLMYAVMAFSLVGSLVAFLIYNFSPAKIFMGDTGSLLIGILNSVFVIKFIAIAADPALGMPLQSAPAIGFAILIVPLFDTLRVVTIRILTRRSPFSPDRNHIHHFLLDLGYSHRRIALTCIAGNIAFISLAYLLRFSGTTMDILALSGVSLAIVSVVYYSRPKTKIKSISLPELDQKEIIIKSHKIFTLAGDAVEQN
ncbi:undecaprenyl/decaprenyl-phosphate alpha-N-acetylglucosaminyl 1-phosphate transferase [Ginsengibacter hankyongi]|uniref:Undecaprenyl/decaprenyl-phosphate alpha-N-acetylglucosaminyl 1-phosphate transferase n=1 Tax=Ginsengibacter hankyongi TaxID=2607284 RepID=A0A5J5IHV7_9BACT|nr:MraY family glycosyltransferase [Ginsengibacter hankyongi]KAA9039506.1 undecaprenyl/decaprenyl-phosphate alpha-N-acetylglucosaminyl 1-phosphate transferase [Ginsengibacter hankyongi]